MSRKKPPGVRVDSSQKAAAETCIPHLGYLGVPVSIQTGEGAGHGDEAG